ncbi:MAG: PEP-CTERM sorting domain-containing protein [Gemmatimonadota bacterium]
MKSVRNSLLALSFLALAAPVAGQTPFQFVSGGTVTAFGYYVGTYTGAMGPTYSQTVELNCVDFFHHVSLGQKWTANITRLGDDLSATRAGPIFTNALDLYRQAAWLITQYAGQTATEIGDIQTTIWSLFDKNGTVTPNAPSPATALPDWRALAQLNFQSYADWQNWVVVTDVNSYQRDASGNYLRDSYGNLIDNPNSVQEFLMYQPTVTPEPATVMLFGTGLAGLGWMHRRRKKQSEQPKDTA